MSAIEWTEETWNPVVGCTAVSPGCAHCYAATMAKRLQAMGTRGYDGVVNARGHWTGRINLVEEALAKPLKVKRPTMWFVNSMSDLFHEAVPFEYVDRVFAVMALCPQHTFQVLTKRPERMAEYFNTTSTTESRRHGEEGTGGVLQDGQDAGGMDGSGWEREERVLSRMAQELANFHPVRLKKRFDYPLPSEVAWPLGNVWLGTSVEDQARAEERVPWLLKCPAKVRFLSCEPLLGAVDLECVTAEPDRDGSGWTYRHWNALTGDCSCDCNDTIQPVGTAAIDWVIVGGESGGGARGCDVGWVRSIVGQCKGAGVACFVKQLGAAPMMRQDTLEGRAAGDHPEAEWPVGTRFGTVMAGHEFRGRAALLKDKKGGEMGEWPEDLRVREFPGGR